MDQATTPNLEGFYVSALVRAGKGAMLLGPYTDHATALGNEDRARRECMRLWPQAAWWSYGTTRIVARPGHDLPAGQLTIELAETSAGGE